MTTNAVQMASSNCKLNSKVCILLSLKQNLYHGFDVFKARSHDSTREVQDPLMQGVQSEQSQPAKTSSAIMSACHRDPPASTPPPPSLPPPTLLDSSRRNNWNSAEHKQAVNCILEATSGKKSSHSEEKEEKDIQTPAPRRTSRVSRPTSKGPKGLQFLEDALKLVNPNRESPVGVATSTESPSFRRVAKGRARKTTQASPRAANRQQKSVRKRVYKYISDSEDEDEDEHSDGEEPAKFVPTSTKGVPDPFISAELLNPVAATQPRTSVKTARTLKLFGSDSVSPLAAGQQPSTPTRPQAASHNTPGQLTQREQSIAASTTAPRKQFTTAYASIFGEDDPGPQAINPSPVLDTTVHSVENAMSSAATALGVIAPHQQRSLRACMVCCIIRPLPQFMSEGCPNCEPALQMQGSADTINECTSSNFNGIIAVMTPGESWVAKYHRLDGYVPGMYAVQVIGNLPDDYVEQVRSSGMRYVRRDGNKDEDEEAMGA